MLTASHEENPSICYSYIRILSLRPRGHIPSFIEKRKDRRVLTYSCLWLWIRKGLCYCFLCLIDHNLVTSSIKWSVNQIITTIDQLKMAVLSLNKEAQILVSNYLACRSGNRDKNPGMGNSKCYLFNLYTILTPLIALH